MKDFMTDCILKLCSGEEIFASIIKIEGEMITFDEPMKISKRYTETNQGVSVQLNFEPFLDYSGTTKHTFHRQHCMSCEPLIPRLSTLYTEMKASMKAKMPEHTDSPFIPANTTVH